MTLFKQIALLVSTMFLVLLLIIVLNDLSRTESFQQGQLRTTAQDMATTLGIAISNLPEGDDQATLEVLFYTRIELTGVDGQTIHQKRQELRVEGVPDWFIGLVALETVSGSTQVMKGWTQLGQLELEIHPGFAYSSMYQALVSALRWFALLFVISLLVLWLVLALAAGQGSGRRDPQQPVRAAAKNPDHGRTQARGRSDEPDGIQGAGYLRRPGKNPGPLPAIALSRQADRPR
jgi:hypothetical protein